MDQASLDLNLDPQQALPAPVQADGHVDRTGFEIGWDHAHHGLVPPAELLLNGTPVCQGWLAGKAVFGRRVLGNSRGTRAWLALRITAWRMGIAFDGLQVTPHYLAQIHTARCPVLRTPLGGPDGHPDAAVIERLNPQAGYAAGNLAVMSQAAATARRGVGVLDASRRAQAIDAGAAPIGGLDAAAWRRVAALRALATPLSFHNAARLPLAVLPPNRVRVLNSAQGLQALLTLQFAAPGWAARTRAIAALLPAHTLRHDFNLFIGALAPRVLEARADSAVALRQVLEDVWQNDRVQRRWQHFVLSLGDAVTANLLERATAQGLAGVRTLNHAVEQATEGWGLAHGGQVRQALSATGPAAQPRATPFAPARSRPPMLAAAGSVAH